MAKKIFVDTNILLNPSFLFEDFEKVFMSIVTVEELDNQKTREDIGYLARKALRNIENATNKEIILNCTDSGINFLEHKNDNTILKMAYEVYQKDFEVVFYTDDLNVKIKADSMNLPCERYQFKKENFDLYKGYKEVVMTDYQMSIFYQCMTNSFGLNVNEYLIIKNELDEIVDKLKWTEKGFKNISYKTVDSRYVGKVKPRNTQQELYMDILQDKESKVKVVQGGYGTGKDYLALANFLNLVEKGLYQKIIWIRNNIEAKDTKPIGFLPGTMTEKLSAFADIVGDFVGDKVGFEMLLQSGKLELVHTGFLRGRDLRNSIIYCTEAQNMSASLVKLIVSRISEGSIAFFNGDVKQIDDNCFNSNNGLNLLVNKLQNNPLFGYVYLDKCERSEVAQLASLLD